MEKQMTIPAKPVKFGSLLIEMGLITRQELDDALLVSPQFGLPLGRTLVLSGMLTEEELQLAIELQPLVNSKTCTVNDAKKCVSSMRDKGLSQSEALDRLGVSGREDRAYLGTLLLEAGLVTHTQLEQSKRKSYETGIRLGRLMIMNGFITHNVLTKALHFQTMVRDRRISQKQAVDMLMAQAPRQADRPIKLAAIAVSPGGKKQVQFGEFLVLSGLATEGEILTAMETSLSNQSSLEQAIIELGLMSQKIYDRAVEVHNKVNSGEYALRQATDIIHTMVFGSSTANEETTLPVLGELLKMAGFVTDSDIKEAIALSSKYSALIGKMLVISGAIDEAILIASLRCQFLMKHGVLSLQQAVTALQFSRDNKVSFDDALDELGIVKPKLAKSLD